MGWRTLSASSRPWLRPTPSRPTCGGGSDGAEHPWLARGRTRLGWMCSPSCPRARARPCGGRGSLGHGGAGMGQTRLGTPCLSRRARGAPVPLRVETPQAVNAVFCCSDIKHGCCLDVCGWKRNVSVPPLLLGTVAGCHPGEEPAGVWRAAQSLVGQPLSLPTPALCCPQLSPRGSPCSEVLQV